MCRDDEGEETGSVKGSVGERGDMLPNRNIVSTDKGFFDVPNTQPAIEYKKGYVMRKCCLEPNGKKSEFLLSYLLTSDT